MKKSGSNIDWLLIFLLSALLFILFSCNAYKKISITPPISHKDSGYLSGRCVATFPPKPPIIKEGKTIYLQDSSSEFKAIADSLRGLKKDTIAVHDTICNTYATDSYNNGFDLGYKVGKYDGKSTIKSTFRVDTMVVHSSEDSAAIFNLQLLYNDAVKRADKAETQRDIYQKEKRTYQWLFIGLLALNIALVGLKMYLKFKKSS